MKLPPRPVIARGFFAISLLFSLGFTVLLLAETFQAYCLSHPSGDIPPEIMEQLRDSGVTMHDPRAGAVHQLVTSQGVHLHLTGLLLDLLPLVLLVAGYATDRPSAKSGIAFWSRLGFFLFYGTALALIIIGRMYGIPITCG